MKEQFSKITSEKSENKLENLIVREDVINGDFEDIIYIHWLKYWDKELF